MQRRAADLTTELGQHLAPPAVLAPTRGLRPPDGAGKVAGAHAAAQHAQAPVLHTLAQAVIHHAVGQREHKVSTVIADSRRWLARNVDEVDGDLFTRFLGVAGDDRPKALRGRDVGVDRIGPGHEITVTEQILDRRRDLLGRDITNDQERHVARDVPGVVIPLDGLAADCCQDFLGADGDALAEAAARCDALDQVIQHPLLGRQARAALLEDDRPLLLDALFGQDQVARDVAEEGQPRAKRLGLGVRQADGVARAVEAGDGVLMAAETQAQILEERPHRAGGEVGAAGEGQVLEEVGQPPLVVVLVERARVYMKPEFHPPGRLGVGQDRPVQPVLERAADEAGVLGELGLRVEVLGNRNVNNQQCGDRGAGRTHSMERLGHGSP